LPYLTFSEAVRRLEEAGEVVSIEEEVSAEVEAPLVIRELASSTGKAVLLRRVKGKDYPLVSGVYYRRQPQLLGLGSLEDVGQRYLSWLSMFDNPLLEQVDKLSAIASIAWLSDHFPRVVSVSPSQFEVIQGYELDAASIPALRHSVEEDAAYIANPVVLLKPSRSKNLVVLSLPVGVLDERTLLLVVPPRSRAYHVIGEAAASRDRVIAAVLVGAPPPLQLAAAIEWAGSPGALFLSGLLSGSYTPITRIVDEIPLPVGAEAALVGEIEPGDTRPGGRVMLEDGYLAPELPHPVVRLRRLVLRKSPVFYTSIIDREASDVVEISRWRDFFLLLYLRRFAPFVKNLRILPDDAFRTIVVSVERASARDLLKLGMFILSINVSPRLDTVVFVDRDVDVNSPSDILRALLRNVDPGKDVTLMPSQGGSRDAEAENYAIVDATSSRSKAAVEAGGETASRLKELVKRLALQRPSGF
jgi:4-hydroxy-3-polyprenylbenzoate decarboxylase